jgi:hypothetical protein
MILARDRNTALLAPIFFIALLTLGGATSLLVSVDDRSNPFKDFYLIPWVLFVGVVLALPSIFLFYKGRFDFFHPMVFAAWSYFVPAFFVGGLLLASGLSNPYFISFIEDEHYNLPLTLVYVAVGYASLVAGFYLPFAKRAANLISNRLPVWNWNARQLLYPGLVLLGLGLANSILAFFYGAFGYQRVDEIDAFNGLVFLLTLFWLVASFLLWLAIFRTERLEFNHYAVIAILMLVTLSRYAYQGNRGGLFQIFILVSCAFVYSKRRITFKHKIYGCLLLAAAILGGMIYGTTFRSIKQTEAVVSADKYTESVFATIDNIGGQDLGSTIEQGIGAMAERLETVSTLAVVVSNYEKLAPYEESYGLDNNIYKDSITFFIPRPLWADKPVASEPRKYSELYFNFGENSFGITPMGDLLRNFGPYGIVFGMIVLGFVIRLFYTALVEDKEFSYWRATLYYMLLTAVSYEGFYGVIIPYLIRVAAITMVGLFIVRFLTKRNFFRA